jgi:NitT/TauT family transport system ATP-binding protein
MVEWKDRSTLAEGKPGTAAKPSGAFISLDHLRLSYRTATGEIEAVRDVSLDIAHGEFISIVGPSGCGKSTLLKMIAGLRQPSGGTLVINSGSAGKSAGQYGMVFQSPVLLPWRNTIGNVTMAAELASLPVKPLLPRASELLKLAGLENFAGKFPRELSGGMQQRAALCRALLLDPPVLLMDEPFGALDAMTRDEMNLELLRIWGENDFNRKTVIFVTHSIPEAVFLGDRVVVMTPRPGRVAKIFDVELPRPRTVERRASAEFGKLSLAVYEALRAVPPSEATLL